MSPPASARRGHRPRHEGAKRPGGEGRGGRRSGGGPPGVCPERLELSGAATLKVHGLQLDRRANRPKCKNCGKAAIDARVDRLKGHPGTLVISCRKCGRVFGKLSIPIELALWLIESRYPQCHSSAATETAAEVIDDGSYRSDECPF